jgi:hypothetical protein
MNFNDSVQEEQAFWLWHPDVGAFSIISFSLWRFVAPVVSWSQTMPLNPKYSKRFLSLSLFLSVCFLFQPILFRTWEISHYLHSPLYLQLSTYNCRRLDQYYGMDTYGDRRTHAYRTLHQEPKVTHRWDLNPRPPGHNPKRQKTFPLVLSSQMVTHICNFGEYI